jgi:hypothetical protein
MKLARHACSALAAALLSLTAPGAVAAPDEIQVYTEEMSDPGEFGLELHVNYAIKGAKEPSYESEKPGHHMLQVTPEFTYGVTKVWEAGLYLPMALDPNGNLYNNGLRLRMKHIAQREEGTRFFWGFSTESGYASRRTSESYWGLELRPIIGYRDEDWLLSFNPVLDMSLSNNVSRAPQFEPGIKITRRTVEGVHAGFEYYGEYGPLRQILPASQRSHALYAVLDIETRNFDINFGIGHGSSETPDKWVAKAIVALPFK